MYVLVQHIRHIVHWQVQVTVRRVPVDAHEHVHVRPLPDAWVIGSEDYLVDYPHVQGRQQVLPQQVSEAGMVHVPVGPAYVTVNVLVLPSDV